MIFSVIVTFNPVYSKVSNLVNMLHQSGVTPIVVDNRSNDEFELDCTLIKLSLNRGIAFAQNIGIKEARSKGAKSIIFFDQDSILPDLDFINKLSLPISNRDTLISAPIFIDEARGFTYPIVDIDRKGNRTKIYPTTHDSPFVVSNVISSGTLVNIEVFDTVGLMSDELFIDYVDTEWCLRCAKHDYQILVIPSAVMYHSIGDSSFSLLGFNIPKHSPLRRYYRVRNSFFLLRQRHVPKLMAIREVAFSIVHQLLLVSAGKGERRKYLKFLFFGVFDGIKGRFGAYSRKN
ncbi:TPA: rhamnosyltransferase [Vibrio parahaemolyticus]|nr:rhamnosyltransferase [Vibrio parahaemolyticus]